MFFIQLLTVASLALQSGDTAKYTKYEEEGVAKFRKVYEFVLPPVSTDAEGVLDSSEIVSISPDSFGVNFELAEGLQNLILKKTALDAEVITVEGFRIQIYAGDNIDNAHEARLDFIQNFDEIDVYQIWKPPHFRVRVGDFLSSSEAMVHVAEIRQIFPDAFIVKDDKVKVPKFKEDIPDENDLEEVRNNDKPGNDSKE